MALNIHAQDVPGMCTNFISIICQLDAARFTATAHLYLSFNDGGVSSCICSGNGLINSDCNVTL